MNRLSVSHGHKLLLSCAISLALLGTARAEDPNADVLDKLKAQLLERQQQIQDLEQENSTLKAAGASTAAKLEEATAGSSDMQSQIEMCGGSTERLAAQRNKLFRQLKEAQQATGTVSAKASVDAERMQGHILGLYDKRDSLTDELAACQAEASLAADNSERRKVYTMSLNQKLYALEQELAAAQSETEAGDAKIVKMEASRESLIDQLIDLRNSSDNKNTALKRMLASHKRQLGKARKQAKKADTLQIGRDELASRMFSLRDSTDSEIAGLEGQLADQTAELDALRAKNRTLGNVAKSTKTMLGKARTQLDEMKAEKVAMAAAAETAAPAAQPTATTTTATSQSFIDPNWSDNLSGDLTSLLSDLPGTEVSVRDDGSVGIQVGNNGLFRTGSVSLSTNGQQTLETIGNTLLGRSDTQINVVGHTDNIPTGSKSRFANNMELSIARSSSAVEYLNLFVGIPSNRLVVNGAGDSAPVATNATTAGRAQNRRIEMILTPR